MDIKYLELGVRPIDSDVARSELDIRIEVDGLVHGYRKVLRPDDFSSRYDQIFEEAKQALKEQVEKGQE